MKAARGSGRGPERYLLGLALLVPLVVAALVLTQGPWVSLASPSSSTSTHEAASTNPLNKRPASLNQAPPPTLAPPATALPTATPLPPAAEASPTPQPGGTYVVQPGDQLKYIAAASNVPLSKLIAANNIPDPDSLRVGQVLRIPSN